MSASETHVYQPSAAAMKGAYVSGMAAYRKLVAEAEADYEGLLGPPGARVRELEDAVHAGRSTSSDAPFFKWFEDGTLNVSYNCLDRQVERGLGDKIAIIFEADDGQVTRVTYSELLARTCRLANALKARGVKKGDRVVIYMPMIGRGRGRDAGLRAHRRHALGGVRRLLGAEPARPHRRRRRGDGDHRRRADARRQAAAAEGHRRRGASRWAAASR